MRVATILYEDQAGERTEFALHELVIRCVADQVGSEPRSLRDTFHGIPKKGNGNVWAECRKNLRKLTRDGSTLVAVFDDDRVRRMANLPADACKVRLIEELKKECDPKELLRVVLLVRNTETLLEALRDQRLLTGRGATFDDAIVRKQIESRDILFKDAIWKLTADQRGALLGAVPSLRYLVEKLVTLLRATDGLGP